MCEPMYIKVQDPADDTLVAEHFADGTDWFRLIKDLRATYGISIFDAEKMAFAHRGWRRWCNARFDTDARCRKLAFQHIRINGEAALIIREGNAYGSGDGGKATGGFSRMRK